MRLTLRNASVAVLMTAVVLSGAGRVQAQQVPVLGGTKGASTIPLKVTVTLSRFDGDKKTSSLPFVLWVNTGGQPGIIRMGSDVPVPTTTLQGGVPTGSYNYRNLGTSIDCQAESLGEGLYRLSLTVEDSQVFRSNGVSFGTQAETPRPAVFQKFNAQHQPILRDGQQVQFAVATDKTSGEVIKLDVTLNLVK